MSAPLDPQAVLRARARRAHLDRSGGDIAEVTAAIVALHATDPASLHLSVHARQPLRPVAALVSDLRANLEDRRALLRLMAMRRTVHVVRADLAGPALAVSAARVAPDARKLAVKMLHKAEAPALEALRAEVLEALGDADLDPEALAAAVPALALRVSLAEGKSYAGDAPLHRFVLEALSTSGELVRARARGGWRAGGCTWARLDRWAPTAIPSLGEGMAALTRAWLRAFGPATLADLAWWAGVPLGEARAALAALGREVVQVEVRGWPGPRYAHADTALEDHGPPLPPALLPGLDPSGMCVTDRGPFLDPDIAGPLWDRSGNLAPTVWVDGRIVGGWTCRKDGAVVYRILDPAARAHEGAVAEEARRLTEALAGEAPVPRFPTPLTRELAA